MAQLPDTPEAAAHFAKLFVERHGSCKCNRCNTCKCENCVYTKKHGGYMVCLGMLDSAMRHDDVLNKGRPGRTALLLVTLFAGLLVFLTTFE